MSTKKGLFEFQNKERERGRGAQRYPKSKAGECVKKKRIQRCTLVKRGLGAAEHRAYRGGEGKEIMGRESIKERKKMRKTARGGDFRGHVTKCKEVVEILCIAQSNGNCF